MIVASDFIAVVQSGNIAEVRRQIAGDPALVSATDDNGVTAIMQALYCRQHEIAALLIDRKDELDIFEATAAGRLDRVSAILDADPASAKLPSPDGFTALHLAAFFDRADIARILIEHGANVSTASSNAMQVAPLHSAAAAHSREVVHLLLAAGAPTNARQQGGWTPLHAAADNGDLEMTRDLLAYGADPQAANDEGKTAAQIAQAKGHAEVARLLTPA